MTKDEIILAQQARIDQLRECTVEARGYLDRLTQEGVRFRCDLALSITDDLSALRAHDAALTAKHIEICKKLAAENEGLAGEVWCERCADAIEKGGVL